MLRYPGLSFASMSSGWWVRVGCWRGSSLYSPVSWTCWATALYFPLCHHVVWDDAGRGAGKGWFDYSKGDRKPLPSPEVEKMIEEHRVEIGRYVHDATISRQVQGVHL